MTYIEKVLSFAACVFVGEETNKKHQTNEASAYRFANLHAKHMEYNIDGLFGWNTYVWMKNSDNKLLP